MELVNAALTSYTHTHTLAHAYKHMYIYLANIFLHAFLAFQLVRFDLKNFVDFLLPFSTLSCCSFIFSWRFLDIMMDYYYFLLLLALHSLVETNDFMYVCIYTYIYICMYVFIYECVYRCAHWRFTVCVVLLEHGNAY